MNYRILVVIPLIALSFVSCKKEKKRVVTPATPTITYDNYTAMKPGNYWIYQDYRLDSINGEAHALGTYDSNFVEKDTIINGYTYHKYCNVQLFSTGPRIDYDKLYLRDSLHYTVDHTGNILFSSQDFATVFRTFTFGPNAATPDTLTITEQMGYKDAKTTVEAGTFTTSAFRRIYHFPEGYKYGKIREYDFWYAKNIGLVKETKGWYYSSPMILERRLVRYHVQ